MAVYIGNDQVVDCGDKRKTEVKVRVITKKSFVPGTKSSVHVPPKSPRNGVEIIERARDFYNSENKFIYRHRVLSRNCEDLPKKCYEVPHPVNGTQAREEKEGPRSLRSAPVTQKTKWRLVVSGVVSLLTDFVGGAYANSTKK